MCKLRVQPTPARDGVAAAARPSRLPTRAPTRDSSSAPPKGSRLGPSSQPTIASTIDVPAANPSPTAAGRKTFGGGAPAQTRCIQGTAPATSRGARWKVVPGRTAARTAHSKANPSEILIARTGVLWCVRVLSTTGVNARAE